MTHYHHYIFAGRVIDATTRIFVVAIGQSARHLAIYAWLKAYSKAHNHYFCIRSLESSEFIQRVIHSIDDANLSPQYVTAPQLKAFLKEVDDIPFTGGTLHNKHRQRYILNTDYRVSSNVAAQSR